MQFLWRTQPQMGVRIPQLIAHEYAKPSARKGYEGVLIGHIVAKVGHDRLWVARDKVRDRRAFVPAAHAEFISAIEGKTLDVRGKLACHIARKLF